MVTIIEIDLDSVPAPQAETMATTCARVLQREFGAGVHGTIVRQYSGDHDFLEKAVDDLFDPLTRVEDPELEAARLDFIHDLMLPYGGDTVWSMGEVGHRLRVEALTHVGWTINPKDRASVYSAFTRAMRSL